MACFVQACNSLLTPSIGGGGGLQADAMLAAGDNEVIIDSSELKRRAPFFWWQTCERAHNATVATPGGQLAVFEVVDLRTNTLYLTWFL